MQVNNKPICLICNRAVSKFKEYNTERHYVTNQAPKYDKFKDQFRKDKIAELKKAQVGQQYVFTNLSFQLESLVAVTYAIAKVISKRSKPFSDGELVKNSFLCVADVMCSKGKELFEKIRFSRQTIAHCTKELAVFVLQCRKSGIESWRSCSLFIGPSRKHGY